MTFLELIFHLQTRIQLPITTVQTCEEFETRYHITEDISNNSSEEIKHLKELISHASTRTCGETRVYS